MIPLQALVIARFSDVYMIAAEAAFKTRTMQNAADMINIVRKELLIAPTLLMHRVVPAGSPTCYPSTTGGDPYAAGQNQGTAETAMLITAADVTLDFHPR